MNSLVKAYERNAALILASENWAEGYNQAPTEHAHLIKATARLERKLVLFFKQIADTAPQKYINWGAYNAAVQEVKASRINAYDVNVIVNDTSDTNGQLVNIVFDEVLYATAQGAQAGESSYGIQTGLSAINSSIQRQARKQVSQLIGKTVLPDGQVIDNPDATYTISNTTRKQIQDAIHTAIQNGDSVQEAAVRVQKIIKDPYRARLIAHQEMANAYTTGLHMYGQASGAVGKEWQTNGAIDICATNAAAGPIPFTAAYPSGDQHPTAHIGCKCYERLIYQHELDDNPNLFDKSVDLVNEPKQTTPKPKTTSKPTEPADSPQKYAVFTKNNKVYKYEMNGLESEIIKNNNIEMTTAPKYTVRNWGKELGTYVEYNNGRKAVHMRDPKLESSTHTFYHEIGHAIDHNLQANAITDHYANQSTLAMEFYAAYTRDAEALYKKRIADDYKSKGLTEEQINDILNGKIVHYTREKGGRIGRYVGQMPGLAYKRYGMSPSEIFAEAYGLYRTQPDVLKTIAPNLYSVIKDIK